MKTIVVNNPAARSGGALTILKELLDKVSILKCDRKFFVIVSLEELKKYETHKVKILVIPIQGFKDRIIWDNFKLKKYLKEKNIIPNLFISIQNTGVNLNKNIQQIIYFHQALSIADLKWNVLKKNERLYWMYENIYPIFIRQHLNKVKKVIVQAEWVKDKFSKKFGYASKNIMIIRPGIKKINVDLIKDIPKNKFRIFYPATPLIYKNHRVVIEALGLLKKESPELREKIECIFTFSKGENLELDNLIRKLELDDVVKLIGKISYEKVLEYYKGSDLLLFPSYLETFGLPLLEARIFNLPILAADLPYSREVISSYRKSNFINYLDCDQWLGEIRKKIKEEVK